MGDFLQWRGNEAFSNWKETAVMTKTKRKEGRTYDSASPNTKLLRARYNTLKLLQRPFLGGFWFLEQRISRVQDQLASQGMA